MNSTTEILKIKKGETQKRDVGVFQTGTLFGIWVISRVLDVQMISNVYTNLVRRLQLSCEHKNLTRPFSSPNHSNNGEVQICPAAQTLFSVWPISGVLELQITSIFFPGKLNQFPTTFMFSRGPSSISSIFVLFRQEDKDFHQVKSWPPTQQLVIKSIIPNFGL